jgi:muconolactone D-isomerase
MKFLVINRQREVPHVPPEQAMELVINTIQMAKQQVKEGKSEVSYGLAGLSGGMAIYEAESGAELNSLLMSMPLFPYLDIEIFQLMTLDEAITAQKQVLEAIKAQK